MRYSFRVARSPPPPPPTASTPPPFRPCSLVSCSSASARRGIRQNDCVLGSPQNNPVCRSRASPFKTRLTATWDDRSSAAKEHPKNLPCQKRRKGMEGSGGGEESRQVAASSSDRIKHFETMEADQHRRLSSIQSRSFVACVPRSKAMAEQQQR